MILENKTILVSGVGPGLGREIASRVLRDGGNVVIGARKAESLEAAAQELDPSGERVLAHSFDITDEESCARIITATEERFGRLDQPFDCLIPLTETLPTEQMERLYALGMTGTVSWPLEFQLPPGCSLEDKKAKLRELGETLIRPVNG